VGAPKKQSTTHCKPRRRSTVSSSSGGEEASASAQSPQEEALDGIMSETLRFRIPWRET